MITVTLAEIATITGGRVADADPATPVTGPVEFDSRRCVPGGLFVAFDGARVDGHDYIDAARENGAVAALVTRPVTGPHVLVDDAVAAMSALAAVTVARLPELVVVGITGSSGKTSTKDLVAALLTRAGETVAPPGSYNNELGFPYTVLKAGPSTRFLVLELGARGIGHIRHLTGIARPAVGVVLNVGSAHLGEFGSREAIAQAKGELVEALPPDGLAVLNADDPLVSAMRSRTGARVVTVGEAPTADLRAEDVTLDHLGRAAFVLRRGSEAADVALRLSGAHHVGNALSAAAVALECGLTLDDAAYALSEAEAASAARMALHERSDGVLVINDAYNANPESVRAALKALAGIARARRESGGRAFAVLGPMAELGDDGPAEHDAIGRLAVRLDVARVVAVGETARPIQHGAALEGSWDGEASWVPDVDAAVALLRNELRPGDVVLVKASRAAALDRVAEALAQPPDARGAGGNGTDEKGVTR